MIPFAAYTTAETRNAFHSARKPQKLPLPMIHESATQMASQTI